MSQQKMIFFGAGVLGSLYAARLKDAGVDVTIVARGSRYQEIKEHGIVLEHFKTGGQTTTPVRVVDRMPEDEYFDACIIMVRKEQLADALPSLALNRQIPTFVSMVNSAEGPEELIHALGRERVLLGHVNAGGERDGHVVRYMTAAEMTMGELDGAVTDRLRRLAEIFKSAGFPVVLSSNMDAWKRYHVALAIPICTAMYMAGGDNYRLAKSRKGIRMFVIAMREAIGALRAAGYPVQPSKLRLFGVLPSWILVPLCRRVMRMELMDIGGARHARNARGEMTVLAAELRKLIEASGVPTPTLDELYRYLDPAVPPAIV